MVPTRDRRDVWWNLATFAGAVLQILRKPDRRTPQGAEVIEIKARVVSSGINFWASQQSKTYTHFGATEHKLFSERAIGSQPPLSGP